MPQLDLVIGNKSIDLSAAAIADGSIARFGSSQLKLVKDVFNAVLNSPISALATETLKAEFTASHALSWDFQFGPAAGLQVKLEPSASASIEIRRSGELFEFSGDIELDDDLPLEPPAAPQVKPGMAYVSIRLKVTLDASGQFGFTHGPFGIKANAGTGQRFLLAYHHQVTQATHIQDAIVEAFKNFVFPYSAAGAAKLADGCFSEWEHIGKFDVGFEATVGFGGALLGARGASELARSLSSDVGKLAVSLKPQFNVGASFSVGYTHEDAFRIVLSATDANHADFFLYKMNRKNLSIGAGLNASAKLNASVQLENRIADLTGQQIERLLPASLPGRAALLDRLKKSITPAELQDVTAEIEERVNDFLSNLDRLSATASITSERIRDHVALMSYRIARSQGGGAGFKAVLEGRLRDAVASPGVEVAPGSFVRDTVTRRTTMRLQLFGALEAKSVDEYVRFGEMVYDGNGVFRIRFTRARRTETDFFGHRKQIEILFTATAKSFLSGHVTNADVRLRFTLTDSNKESAARRTASALAVILDGTPDAEVARRMREAINANPKITTRLTCTIAPSAFRNLTFTAFETPHRAKKLPHASDASNYEAFVKAFGRSHPEHLQGEGFPDRGENYSDWAQFNIAVNDSPNAELAENSRPNRRERGNPAFPGNWPQFGRLAGVSSNKMEFIFVCLEAARHFMNSCENLSVLAGDLDKAQTDEAFDRLLEDVDHLAKGELSGAFPLFFGTPTLTAVLAQMHPASIAVEGPAAGGAVRDEFAVKLEVA